MIALTLFFHAGLPLLLASWLALGRPASVVHLVFRMLWIATFVLTLAVAGAGWTWLGMWGRQTVLVVTLLGALVGLGRALRGRLAMVVFDTWRQRIDLLLSVGLFAILSSGIREIGSRRAYEGTPVTLQFPLPAGSYAIVHGGRGESVNQHAPAPPQAYALDIVALGPGARRASGLTPSDPAAYAIWDRPVTAPCAGEVGLARDGQEDLAPLAIDTMDRAEPAGNHVAIFCQDATIFLAHLRKGSVSVTVGQEVQRGTPVGRVGNSGNTSEPHLHVHAVRGRAADVKTGVAAPILFEPGGFLTRNDVVRVPPLRE